MGKAITSVGSGLAVVPVTGAAVTLVSFSVRRIVLLMAALLPARADGGDEEAPSVTLVVPARNEGRRIEAVLDCLDALDYPRDRLAVALVDDASEDDTGSRMAEWAREREGVTVVNLDQRAGKYQAVNRGIATAMPTDVVAVCDGDLRPRPGFLRQLVRPFSDRSVAGVAGFVAPVNAAASLVARYAAVESCVHQLVTSAGKDRLGLNPPLLAASAYRRSILEPMGWFRGEHPGGDARVTMAIVRAGWRTRFVRDAVAENDVVERWSDYWHQHVRWARNSLATVGRRDKLGDGRLAVAPQIELWMQSTGYADRVGLVVALAARRRLPGWLPAAYVGVRAVEVPVAIAKAGAMRHLPSLLLSTAAFFVIDVMASIAAFAAHLGRRPRIWRQPRAGGS